MQALLNLKLLLQVVGNQSRLLTGTLPYQKMKNQNPEKHLLEFFHNEKIDYFLKILNYNLT
jgi:hypothetical protein